MVEDALSHLSIGSVSQLDEAKKDLVKDVHRLSRVGVSLRDSPNGSLMVHINTKSSLVVEGKSKQHLDQPLMELNKSILGKINESFDLGGLCLEVSRKVVCYQCRLFEEPDP